MDPARAGMILNRKEGEETDEGGPRASGDDPQYIQQTFFHPMWTPRERG